MQSVTEIVEYCNGLLNVTEFSDYCPNGLQVEAGACVRKLVTGVTASEALINAAIETQADALLVHHGYFWKGEPAPLTGIKGKRIARLMTSGISLIAYHLPLDAHPVLGNNRLLGERLGFSGCMQLDDKGLLWGVDLAQPLSSGALAERISGALRRNPLHLGGGPQSVTRIGWCTGAAQGYIEQAAGLGCDAFISGEVSEQTMHQAKELGIHYYSAGHHATERSGVRALGNRLAEKFSIVHQYIDVPNPV